MQYSLQNNKIINRIYLVKNTCFIIPNIYTCISRICILIPSMSILYNYTYIRVRVAVTVK